MRKFVISLILVFVNMGILFSASADVIKAEFSAIENHPIDIGDTFQAVLKVTKEIDTPAYQKAIADLPSSIGGAFYVIKLDFIKNEGPQSLVGLSLVYENVLASDKFDLELVKGEVLEIKVINPELYQKDPVEASQNFFILELEKGPSFWIWIVLASLLGVGLLAFGLKKLPKYLKEKKKKREEAQKRNQWQLFFKKAYKREDFEEIYKKRQEWEQWASHSKSNQFFRVLDNYQYKKNWSQEEMAEVTRNFNSLRDEI
ncbi:MAG: hypothetical protein H6621_06075 [Halobacteriovoraceae bacterium]|nr:hypothetical protein [Halobacteriovoraceae bacterium]